MYSNDVKQNRGHKVKGVSMPITLIISSAALLLSACSTSSPLPMYKQVEVPKVRAYQGEVNGAKNYIYRADQSDLFQNNKNSKKTNKAKKEKKAKKDNESLPQAKQLKPS